MPDSDGDPRDSLIGLFSAVRRDYGPGGVRVELAHVGILPAWGQNNRNDLAAGRVKSPVIRPVLIDREIPRIQGRLDALSKLAQPSNPAAPSPTTPALTPEQSKEFIDLTNQLKVLSDRRDKILARTGDEYLTDPPKRISPDVIQ
jgi:hypothetical protein